MKTYSEIGIFRMVNIKVILNDEKVLYEGIIEDAPMEIKELKYSKLKMSNVIILYVYE